MDTGAMVFAVGVPRPDVPVVVVVPVRGTPV
jgi:hypothetical protein